MSTMEKRIEEMEIRVNTRRLERARTWAEDRATPEELAAFTRAIVNSPNGLRLQGHALAELGISRDAYERGLAQIGPLRPGDLEMARGLFACMPGELAPAVELLGWDHETRQTA